MDMQDVVSLVGPLAALATAAISVVAGISRYRSTAGLRSKIQKDAALISDMPDGRAKECVEAAMTHRAARYQDRVVGGYQPSYLQLWALYGALTVAIGAAVTLAVVANRHGWTSFGGPPDVVVEVYSWLGGVALIIGCSAIVLSVALAATGWWNRHFYRAHIEWLERQRAARRERRERVKVLRGSRPGSA